MQKSDAEIYSIIDGLVSRRKQGLSVGFNPTLTRTDRTLVALRLRELATMVEEPSQVAVQRSFMDEGDVVLPPERAATVLERFGFSMGRQFSRGELVFQK